MSEDNKIFKTNEFSIEISPVGKAIQAKDIQYFSYDENSGLQLIHILMDGKPLDLPSGTEIRLSAVKLNNQNQKLIYTPEIVDPLKGIVSFVIPREFLGYRGQIRCGLYINFSNNQTMHVGYFYINMGVSDIDTNLTEFTEDFWQGWSEFEACSTAKMQELEQRIDEQTEIFNNADVYNKAEIEDKLEPFALQTDIDTLEIKKADKIALAQTNENIENLDSTKADKTALANTNQQVSGLASNKVDKGGAGQVTWGMIAQDARDNISGNKVAIVGPSSVGTTNIVNQSVTRDKMAFPTEIGVFVSKPIKIDHTAKKVIIGAKTILSSTSNASIFTNETEIQLDITSPSAALYLIFDKNDNVYKLNWSNNTPNTVMIGLLYSNRFYPSTPESLYDEYPTNINKRQVAITFINFKAPRIRIDSVAKTIKIDVGNCAINNMIGQYYRVNADINIDYSDLALGGDLLPSLYFNTVNKTYYVGTTPKMDVDVKVFTWYGGKIYGADQQTQNITIVDGVGNGGWVTETPSDSEPKYHSIDEWFSNVARGASSKIVWLGDSTWAGYTGPVNGSTTPFPQLIQGKLDEYFGTGNVVSANESISGKVITYFSEQINTILTEHADADLVMIGCGLNGINQSSTEDRREAMENIVNACIAKSVLPVICTAQAHQVPNTETGDDWGGRSQFYTEKYDRTIRLGVAKKYNLDVLDYTTFTQKILDNAPESITDLVQDGLHGSAKMHAYQRDWTFSQLVSTVKSMTDTGIVSIYDQKIYASRSLRYVEGIDKDADGFKTQWNFDAVADDVLMDVWVFLEPEKSTLWNIKAVGTGAFKMIVNGADIANDLTDQKSGLYHIKILATGGQVTFKGVVFDLKD